MASYPVAPVCVDGVRTCCVSITRLMLCVRVKNGASMLAWTPVSSNADTETVDYMPIVKLFAVVMNERKVTCFE
jgi:hypothetical protein